MQWQINSLVSK